MATMVIAPVEIVSTVEIPLTFLSPTTYAVDHDRAERADPLADMRPPHESGVRNRGTEPRSTRVVAKNHEISPGEEQDLTASSGDNDPQTKEPSHQASLVVSIWRRLYKALARNPFHGQTIEQKHDYDVTHGYDKLRYNSVADFPEGFPQLAAFLNADDDFAVFRRFGLLSSRILIQMQIDLADLERELNALDHSDASNPNPNMKFRLNGAQNFDGWNNEKQLLLDKSLMKLQEYYKLLLQDSQVRALGQPAKRHRLGLINWVWNNKPFIEGKDDFVFHINDFVSIANRSGTSTQLGTFIEIYLDRFPGSRLKKLMQTSEELKKSRDPYVDLYAAGRLRILVKAITFSLAVGILLVPVLLLFLVPMPRQLMGWLVFGFVLAFSVTMALVTDAKVHEILVGTAAYGAVLVTFLGNLSRVEGA